MVLILSTRGDGSTNAVIDWIHHFGVHFIRINSGMHVTLKSLDINERNLPQFTINVEGVVINSLSVKSFWYRKGLFNLSDRNVSLYLDDVNVRNTIREHLNYELSICSSYIIHILQEKKYLGDYQKRQANKLFFLELAKKCRLEIVETRILTTIDNLDLEDDVFITKAIGEGISFTNEGFFYFSLTNEHLTYWTYVFFEKSFGT